MTICKHPPFKNIYMLYDNAIFFDDTVSKDGNIVDSKILKYDLETHSLELFRDNAQYPFLYHDVPYYILRRDSGNSYEFTIKAITSDLEIPLTERLHTFYPSNAALYSLENLATDHATKTTTWGIVDIVARQELLSTDITIGEVFSNEYFVTWWNYLEELPVIYCVEQNTFVVIDQVRKATNTFVTYENAGLLISLTFDNNEYYYFSINK